MSAAICPELTGQAERLRFAAGRKLSVTLLRKADAARMAEFFGKLTHRSRPLRCCAELGEMSPKALEQLEDDGRCLVFAVRESGDSSPLLAIGCYEVTRPGTAEVALAVADEVHSRGLGAQLLRYLVGHARQRGIQTFQASVLLENQQLFDLFRQSGYTMSCQRDGGVSRVRLSL